VSLVVAVEAITELVQTVAQTVQQQTQQPQQQTKVVAVAVCEAHNIQPLAVLAQFM
jgi:hypothetical protein